MLFPAVHRYKHIVQGIVNAQKTDLNPFVIEKDSMCTPSSLRGEQGASLRVNLDDSRNGEILIYLAGFVLQACRWRVNQAISGGITEQAEYLVPVELGSEPALGICKVL